MTEQAKDLISKLSPLSQGSIVLRANCFNAVQLLWGDTKECRFVGPEEFVAYLQTFFLQVSVDEASTPGDVSVLWSRTSMTLPLGAISIDELRRDREGYPFGLVIEHAFVSTQLNLVFQKRDPTAQGPYELISEQVALRPYQEREGFELTRHRRRT